MGKSSIKNRYFSHPQPSFWHFRQDSVFSTRRLQILKRTSINNKAEIAHLRAYSRISRQHKGRSYSFLQRSSYERALQAHE